jgi:nucleotide-binding universal stress UspA family protein
MVVNSVVVGVDGSAAAEDALVWALQEGRVRKVPVRVVNVWHPDGSPVQAERLAAMRSVAELRDRVGDEVAAGVRAVVERAGATDVAVTTIVRYGHPAQELVNEAGSDALLVVGSRGRGSLAGTLLGSVSQTCAQQARSPVVVVRGKRPHTPAGRVVVGVDGSPPSVRALRFAHDAAARRGAELQVVHTWSVPYMGFAGPTAWPQDALDEIEAQAAATLRDSVHRAAVDTRKARLTALLRQGPPAASLLDLAEDADLLVVGSRGFGGWKGLLAGSVSTRAITQAPGPVTVVPADADPWTTEPR